MRQQVSGMGAGKDIHTLHLPSGLPVGLPVTDLGRKTLGGAITMEGAVRMCLEDNINQLISNAPYSKMVSEHEKKEILLASHLMDLPDSVWAKLSYVLHQDMQYSRMQKGKFDIPDFNHLSASFIATYLIARDMGYHNRQCIDLATGGFVHDISKLPQISHKPSLLTPEERELDKLHPAEGYELLLDSGETRPEVLEPTWMHQKWISSKNGAKRYSYPEDAPTPTLFARIVTVGEVGDVMLRGRIYRKDEEARKGSVRRTISELERESLETEDGLHFDKDVVSIYVPRLKKAL